MRPTTRWSSPWPPCSNGARSASIEPWRSRRRAETGSSWRSSAPTWPTTTRSSTRWPGTTWWTTRAASSWRGSPPTRASRPGPRGPVGRRPYAHVVLHVALLGPLEVTRDDVSSCACRAARRRSCWSAWRSRPACSCAPTGSSTSCGARRRRHPPQHAAVEGRPAAPRPRRPAGGRPAATAATSSTSSRPSRRPRRPRCGRARRPIGSPPATTRAPPTCATATLALYRGEVLQGIDGEWADGHRARLEAARMQLVETLLSARLRLGALGEVIGELEAAVADLPVPGEPVGAADHRPVPGRTPGRRAGGLPAGAQPAGRASSASTRARSCSSSSSRSSSTTRRWTGRPSTARRLGRARRPGNLPSLAVELVGRDDEVAAVAGLLARERLVEIVGPGGVGKTAVAIAVGRERGDRRRRRRGRCVAGPARDGHDRRRGRRRARRGVRRQRRRGGAARAAQGRHDRW